MVRKTSAIVFALIFLFVSVIPLAYADNTDLATTYDSLVRNQGLNPATQAACASDSSGILFTYGTDTHIIPASVSKLYVFDFALSKLPTNFRYTTTFILHGSTLYANGTGDPEMNTEHLKSVLNQVQTDSGIPVASIVISPDFYFEMTRYQPTIRAAIAKAVPGVRVTSAAAPYDGEGTRYTFESIPLPAFLKNTSNYSNNFYADTLFDELGGSDAMADYLLRTYGVGPETAQFKTGSGLSGNYTTCTLTLQILQHLDKALAARNLALTDVMTMPVVDPGVLSKRGIDSMDVESLVAKSGYVNSHHNLSGIINSDQGHVYFAVFTDYPMSMPGKQVNAMIDEFTNDLLAAFHPSLVSFNYNPDPSIFKDYLVSVN